MAVSPATSDQDKEIAQLKSSYDGQVKVISMIGDFTNVVTVQPRDLDIQCKFQLTESYPSCTPTISIRSSMLKADQTASLTAHLQNKADVKVGHSMLADLMDTCKAWLEEQKIDMTVQHTKLSPPSKKTGKSKASKQKTENTESDKFIKKPPMKTAADVIKRLQWDKSVNVDDFTIGYMDRITGLEEQPFSAFTWEDLASVDQFCLAIPQHRIQYFKYKTEKVWDKNERLDNIFGSTGSNMTIVETVQKYDQKQRTVEENSGASCGRQDKHGDEEGTEQEGDAVHEVSQESNEDPDLGDADANDISEQTAGTDMELQQRVGVDRLKRPNHFVAFQITDKQIVRKLKDVQGKIITAYSQYEPHLIPENGFHLTLSVLRLENADDATKCAEAMNKLKPDLVHLARNSGQLSFIGLDHFSTNVIFAKVQYTKAFIELVDIVKYKLIEAGVNLHMDNGFIPHLTLFKVGRSASRDRNWKKDTLHLQSYSGEDFGSQPVDNIQVCQMGTLPDIKTEDAGFYTPIFKLHVHPPDASVE